MEQRSPVALVVDDDRGVKDAIRSMLRMYGFHVIEAEGIRDAERIVAGFEGTIDLVIANHELRDGIGKHAIETVRQLRPGIRVLRYSGYPLEELQRTGGINDGVPFIQKPFRVDQFIAKVREVLGWLPERRRTAEG